MLATALITGIDYLTGTELRVYPLYFGPIAFAGWRLGRGAAMLTVLFSVIGWAGSNYVAGMRFSHSGLWLANAAVHSVAFVTVGLLIASLRQSLVRERHLSRCDGLTGLLNSRAFHEEAGHLLALCRRKGRPVAIAYLDLDGFKAVNDRFGHQAGDRLLRDVATRLRANTRTSDLCARIGGDEFLVLLPDVAPEEAEAAMGRVHASLSATAAGAGAGVSASLGGVTYLALPDELEAMVSAADQLMYRAKADGKNRMRLEVVGR